MVWFSGQKVKVKVTGSQSTKTYFMRSGGRSDFAPLSVVAKCFPIVGLYNRITVRNSVMSILSGTVEALVHQIGLWWVWLAGWLSGCVGDFLSTRFFRIYKRHEYLHAKKKSMWWNVDAHLIICFNYPFFRKIRKIHFFTRRKFSCTTSQ